MGNRLRAPTYNNPSAGTGLGSLIGSFFGGPNSAFNQGVTAGMNEGTTAGVNFQRGQNLVTKGEILNRQNDAQARIGDAINQFIPQLPGASNPNDPNVQEKTKAFGNLARQLLLGGGGNANVLTNALRNLSQFRNRNGVINGNITGPAAINIRSFNHASPVNAVTGQGIHFNPQAINGPVDESGALTQSIIRKNDRVKKSKAGTVVLKNLSPVNQALLKGNVYDDKGRQVRNPLTGKAERAFSEPLVRAWNHYWKTHRGDKTTKQLFADFIESPAYLTIKAREATRSSGGSIIPSANAGTGNSLRDRISAIMHGGGQ